VIAGWHANTVRVPLNEACWLGVDKMPAFGTAAGYRAAVQDWVNTLHGAGLAVILDLHWSAPAGLFPEGQRAMPDDRTPGFWSSVATTFKDDRSVMFDVFNEPYSRTENNGTVVFDLTWACWRDGGCAAPQVNDQTPPNGLTYTAVGMQQLVSAVRAAGATQPILVAGRDYANDLTEWLANRPADDQLVATFHNYKTQVCNSPACWDTVIAPIAAQVPVVTGEFGQTDCASDYLTAYMDWADAHGIGYLGWGWWVLPDKACSVQALIADASGTPRAPNGTALKAHLDALAARSAPGGSLTPAGLSPASGQTGPQRPGGQSADETAPKLAIAIARIQPLLRTLTMSLRCGEPCTAKVRGSLVVTRGKARQTFGLHAVRVVLKAGATRKIALPISRQARNSASQALSHGGKATAKIAVTATDAARNAVTTKRTITLTRRRGVGRKVRPTAPARHGATS
jgi:hypothetical protein